MNKKIKILTSVALAVVITLTCFLSASPVSQAAYATYGEASSSYKSGKYYTALTKVQLTGDLRKDIVNVAISQIGYQEASSSGQYSGTVMGSNNYTEYGRWFGLPNGQWCAMFVSWCAYVAGVSTSVIPKHSYTENGAAFYLSKNRAYDWDVIKAGVYTPQPGDVVYFYGGTEGRTVTHIGLVEKFQNGILYTIEGNASTAEFTTDGGCCCRRQYNMGSEYVKYICNPDYESTEEGIDAPTENGYYKSLGYYATTNGLNMRNIPSSTASGSSVLGTMSSGSYFNCLEVVKDSDSSQNKYWAKINYNGSTAYMSLNSEYIIYLGDTLPEAFDPYSLATNKSEYITGEMIFVTVKGTRAADWVGVYKKGENSDVNNGGVKAIYYADLTDFTEGSVIINGASDNLGTGGRSDASAFSKGLPAGKYTVKYFKNGTYEVVKSVDITVKTGSLEEIDFPEPQWAWDFGQQAYYAPGGMSVTSTSDYITLTDTTGDSWVYPGTSDNLGSNAIDLDKAKYAAIKIRITKNYSGHNQIELLAKAGQIVTYKILESTPDWQYVIIDCSATLAGTWSGRQTWFRIDPVNSKGSVCDLDWIAFFTTSAEANEFVFAEKSGLIDSVTTGGASSSTTAPSFTAKPTATPKPSGSATSAPSSTGTAVSTDNVSETPTGNETDVTTGDSTELPAGDVTGEPTQETGAEVNTDLPQSGETAAPDNDGDNETAAPSETKEPVNDNNGGNQASSKEKKGCGSVIYGGGAMAVVLAAAMVLIKKRK